MIISYAFSTCNADARHVAFSPRHSGVSATPTKAPGCALGAMCDGVVCCLGCISFIPGAKRRLVRKIAFFPPSPPGYVPAVVYLRAFYVTS